jgi:hypothetical protein
MPFPFLPDLIQRSPFPKLFMEFLMPFDSLLVPPALDLSYFMIPSTAIAMFVLRPSSTHSGYPHKKSVQGVCYHQTWCATYLTDSSFKYHYELHHCFVCSRGRTRKFRAKAVRVENVHFEVPKIKELLIWHRDNADTTYGSSDLH